MWLDRSTKVAIAHMHEETDEQINLIYKQDNLEQSRTSINCVTKQVMNIFITNSYPSCNIISSFIVINYKANQESNM